MKLINTLKEYERRLYSGILDRLEPLPATSGPEEARFKLRVHSNMKEDLTAEILFYGEIPEEDVRKEWDIYFLIERWQNPSERERVPSEQRLTLSDVMTNIKKEFRLQKSKNPQ